jgi:hypothetical protein
MTKKINLVDSRRLSRARKLANRTLSRKQIEKALQLPISAQEYADKQELITWFNTRYPTTIERLAYIRRAHLRWRVNS